MSCIHSFELQETERKKERLHEQIPPEPDTTLPNTIRLLLKTPGGTRIERSFIRSESMKVIFCHLVFYNVLF